VIAYKGFYQSPQKHEYCILTELMSGGDLLDFIEKQQQLNAKLNWAQGYKFLHAIGETLVHLHRYGIVHSDIKPANIFLGEKDNLKVGDFGMSVKLEGAQYYQHNYARGTEGFMAPEIRQLNQYSFATDIYAFGGVIFQVLTFDNPNEHLYEKSILSRINRHVTDLPADAPLKLAHLIKGCWSRKPADRPTAQVVVEVIEALKPSISLT